MLLSRNLKKNEREIVTFIKEFEKFENARLTLLFALKSFFGLPGFWRFILQNTQKCSFFRFSELTLIFTSFCCGFSDPIFICAKLFCFFERNIWTSHSRNLWKFAWKLKLTRKIGKCIFFYFLTGNFNCNDSEWNNVNNVATNAQNWELEQKVWSCRD